MGRVARQAWEPLHPTARGRNEREREASSDLAEWSKERAWGEDGRGFDSGESLFAGRARTAPVRSRTGCTDGRDRSQTDGTQSSRVATQSDGAGQCALEPARLRPSAIRDVGVR